MKAAATTGPKAYSYIRFSTPEQALGDSKRRQVWDALEALPEDGNRTEANQAMREAFETVTVDHRDETLTLRWRHGGESFLPFGAHRWE